MIVIPSNIVSSISILKVMICKFLLIILLAFGGYTNKVKYNNVKAQIKEVIVYLDFQERGYTTAGAYTHFDDLDRERVDTVVLSADDLNNFELALANAAQEKHKQTKFGGHLVFCKVRYADREKVYSRVVIGEGLNRILVSDLTRRINFEIVETNHRQLIIDIFNRLKQD